MDGQDAQDGGVAGYLTRVMSHRATLSEPRDLARLLASYARDGLARVEASGEAIFHRGTPVAARREIPAGTPGKSRARIGGQRMAARIGMRSPAPNDGVEDLEMAAGGCRGVGFFVANWCAGFF